MSVFIPYKGRFVPVRSEDEPHPSDVCEGDCYLCFSSELGCQRDTRIMEDIADHWMVQDLLEEWEKAG
jgi:hypothetical protein